MPERWILAVSAQIMFPAEETGFRFTEFVKGGLYRIKVLANHINVNRKTPNSWESQKQACSPP